jgi:rRNA maturation endonuclease Nob1
MASEEVLDTAALIAWPMERIVGGMVLEAQREELYRVAPDRLVLLDAVEVNWATPGDASIEASRKLAMLTGDIAGLSSIDLKLLALAMERGATLFTDDYRLQNLCSRAEIPWASVMTEGIDSIWSWEVRCTGCGVEHEIPSQTSASKGDIGDCDICGSPLRAKRRK